MKTSCRCWGGDNLLFLEHYNGISFQVTHIDLLALLFDIGMFSTQQPTHMGKEETTSGIVWICVSIGKFMMHTMISGPFVNVILEGQRLAQHQKDAQWHPGFIGTMRP